VLALVATGCTGRPAPDPVPTPTPRAATSPTATTAVPSPSPVVTDPVSLPALMDRQYDGRALRARQVLARTDAYTRYYATFRSGSLRISGVMNVPRGPGPFPVVVLLHGYIDPAVYENGQGLLREQDYLARRGYVALHVDYRGHAGSDPAPGAETNLRLG
jgi:hypothetical protein